MSTAPHGPRDLVVERITTLLSAGTVVIVVTVAMGCLLLVAAGRTPVLEPGPALDVARVPTDVLALRPEGWLWLGLLATVGLPVARVGVALLGFSRNRERRLVAVSAATLGVLATSVAIALASR